MAEKEIYSQNALTLEVREESETITVNWQGKSDEREPGRFLTPLLNKILERGGNGTKRIVLDFKQIAYVNSSTVTPIFRLLGDAKRGTHRVTVLYQKALKWQDLTFSAMGAYSTRDGRIQVSGL